MRKHKIILLGFIAAFAVSLIAGVATLGSSVNASGAPAWGSVTVEESYEYGSTFSLPERKIVVGGKYGKVTTLLRYPDGTETKEPSVKLDEAGIYTLRFIAEASGEVYLDEINFTVTAKYATAGEKSTVVYNSSSHKPGSGALSVRLAAGETLTFAEPIDIKNSTSSDRLIEFMAIPDNIGNQDFEKITVRLTDVHDPSIYVDMISYAYGGSDNGYRSFVLSRGNGQSPKGYFHSGSTLVLNQNVSGTSTAHSFIGSKGADGEQQYSSVRLAFDYDSNSVYVNERYNIDLDSPDCFPELLWSGFTGSKVKMSITCDLYSASTANFEIYSVYGLDISKSLYKDDVKPEIVVEGERAEMPLAEVGKSYKVPSAYAFDDVSGYLDVDCKVAYNYNSKNPVSISVENGVFKTNYAGYYAIVYRAKDFSGNETEKNIWVNCVSDAPDPTINIDENGKQTEVKVGETTKVAEATVSGGSGNCDLKVYAEHNGEKIAISDGKFVPESAGVYKIVYVATDEICQTAEADYSFTAVVSSSPVFSGDAVLPSVLIAGGSYKIPVLIAGDYGGGAKKEVVATCVVTDKNGEKTYNAGDLFVPEIDGKNGAVRFKFIAGTTEKIYEIPCVNVWNRVGNRKRLDFASYVYSEDGVTTEKNENGLKVTVNGEGTAEFITPLLADKFSLTIRGVSGDFGKMSINLTDDENNDVSVTITLEERNGRVYLSVGETTVTPDFSFDGSKNLEIGYSEGKITAAGLTAGVITTDAGKAFAGFKSHKVRMKFAFETNGEKSFYIEKVVNHSFTGSVTSDSTEPAYYVSGSIGGAFVPGEITIPAAYAADVLDPNVSFVISVIDADGNFLSDINGTLMRNVDPTKDYTVNFDKIGEYAVRYVVSDVFNSSANSTPYSVSYTILDDEPPVLKFSGEFKTRIAAGETYVLPKFTVSDNYSSDSEIYVAKYVEDPTGKMNEIPANSNSFKATKAGTYKIILMAVDGSGNVDYYTVAVVAA